MRPIFVTSLPVLEVIFSVITACMYKKLLSFCYKSSEMVRLLFCSTVVLFTLVQCFFFFLISCEVSFVLANPDIKLKSFYLLLPATNTCHQGKPEVCNPGSEGPLSHMVY